MLLLPNDIGTGSRNTQGLPLLALVRTSVGLIEAATSLAFLPRLGTASVCPVLGLETPELRVGATPVPFLLFTVSLTMTIFSFNKDADLLSEARGVRRGVTGAVMGPLASTASLLDPACIHDIALQVNSISRHRAAETLYMTSLQNSQSQYSDKVRLTQDTHLIHKQRAFYMMARNTMQTGEHWSMA